MTTTTPTTEHPAAPRRPLGGWRFWLPFAAQTLLILAVPYQAIYTQITGRPVTLQVAPVDPYDLLRGYYVTLSYDISNPTNLEKLPGWKEATEETTEEANSLNGDATYPSPRSSLFRIKRQIYVILEAPKEPSTSSRPAPWTPIAVRGDRPIDLPSNQVALRGSYEGGRVIYGLEAYYIPEDERVEINNRIDSLQSGTTRPDIVVETKVSDQGNATPLQFWLGDRPYKF